MGEVINQLLAQFRFPAAVVPEVDDEVGNPLPTDVLNRECKIVYEHGTFGIIDAFEHGGGFLAVELDPQPGADQWTHPRLEHVQPVEDGSLVEASIELKIGKIPLRKNPAVIL